MIDQQRWNTYLGINFKDRTLHLCEQNAEVFFVTIKFIVDHAVFTEKQKGNQIPTMDTNMFTQLYTHIYSCIRTLASANSCVHSSLGIYSF